MADARITVKIEGLEALTKAVEDLKAVQIDAHKIGESLNAAAAAGVRRGGRK